MHRYEPYGGYDQDRRRGDGGGGRGGGGGGGGAGRGRGGAGYEDGAPPLSGGYGRGSGGGDGPAYRPRGGADAGGIGPDRNYPPSNRGHPQGGYQGQHYDDQRPPSVAPPYNPYPTPAPSSSYQPSGPPSHYGGPPPPAHQQHPSDYGYTPRPSGPPSDYGGSRRDYESSDRGGGGRPPADTAASRFDAEGEKIEKRIARERPCRVLFVRNVKYNSPTDVLRKKFEDMGEMKSFFDLVSSRGLIFVTYYDLRTAMKAREGMQGFMIQGRPIDIHYSLPKDEDNPQRRCDRDRNQGTLRVVLRDDMRGSSGQPPILQDYELDRMFSGFGAIKGIYRTPDNANPQREKLVEFYDSRAMSDAFDRMNDVPYPAGGKLELFLDWDIKDIPIDQPSTGPGRQPERFKAERDPSYPPPSARGPPPSAAPSYGGPPPDRYGPPPGRSQDSNDYDRRPPGAPDYRGGSYDRDRDYGGSRSEPPRNQPPPPARYEDRGPPPAQYQPNRYECRPPHDNGPEQGGGRQWGRGPPPASQPPVSEPPAPYGQRQQSPPRGYSQAPPPASRPYDAGSPPQPDPYRREQAPLSHSQYGREPPAQQRQQAPPPAQSAPDLNNLLASLGQLPPSQAPPPAPLPSQTPYRGGPPGPMPAALHPSQTPQYSAPTPSAPPANYEPVPPPYKNSYPSHQGSPPLPSASSGSFPSANGSGMMPPPPDQLMALMSRQHQAGPPPPAQAPPAPRQDEQSSQQVNALLAMLKAQQG